MPYQKLLIAMRVSEMPCNYMIAPIGETDFQKDSHSSSLKSPGLALSSCCSQRLLWPWSQAPCPSPPTSKAWATRWLARIRTYGMSRSIYADLCRVQGLMWFSSRIFMFTVKDLHFLKPAFAPWSQQGWLLTWSANKWGGCRPCSAWIQQAPQIGECPSYRIKKNHAT